MISLYVIEKKTGAGKYMAKSVAIHVTKWLNIEIINQRIPNLGLIIDLTNTTKYYHSKDITDVGIEYAKIFVPGHVVPHQKIFTQFMNTVEDFLLRNAANDKLIGVHCTHGLNRTGLMICSYMIQNQNIIADEAISRFENARGHKMERENYLHELRSMIATSCSSNETCEGNCRTMSTQTIPGVWLDKQKLANNNNKRKRYNDRMTAVENVSDIQGTLHVNGRDLISDGFGGYLLQVNLNDIRPYTTCSNSYRSQPYVYNNTQTRTNRPRQHIRDSSSYNVDRRNDKTYFRNNRNQCRDPRDFQK